MTPDEQVLLCWGCRGEGLIPTQDGEDIFECTVCDGSGLADPLPYRWSESFPGSVLYVEPLESDPDA